MKELGFDTITVMKKLKHSLDPKYFTRLLSASDKANLR